MGSLSGNKIKDTYNLLLKLESAEVSASEQVVEDGAGNNSALKLSTDTVETTGELKISGTPSTSTSDVKALMLSTSGVVVTRDLNTNPIGTASITANSPLSATGSTVEIDDPANISQITTPANDDKYLIWDESASEYKYIEQSDLADSIGSTLNINSLSPETFYARLQSGNAVATGSTATQVQFAEIVGDSAATGSTSQATSSVMIGANTNGYINLPESGISDPRDNILINEKEGYFQITASIEIAATANIDVDIEIYDYSNLTVLAEAHREIQANESQHITFNCLYYSNGLAGYRLQLRGKASATGATYVQDASHFEIRFLGLNSTF